MRHTSSFDFEGVKGYKFGYHPFGKPFLFAHIYYIDGLLIDTGQSQMRKDVFQKLKDLPVQQIFITHFHEDHTGNVEMLQKHFDCPVFASQKCIDIMKNPPSISMPQKIFWGSRPSYINFQKVGKTIQTQNYTFQIIPIPGHSKDMIGLYEPTKKWLFSADLYVHYYINYFLKGESVLTQIDSLKRVLELDFEVIFCGHNPQLSDGKEKMQKKVLFFEDFYQKVSNLYQKGKSASQIMKELQLKESWFLRILSNGALSKINMVKSVIRDEEKKNKNF